MTSRPWVSPKVKRVRQQWYKPPTQRELADLASLPGVVVVPITPDQWRTAQEDGFEMFSRSLQNNYNDHSGTSRFRDFVTRWNNYVLGVVGEEVVADYLQATRTGVDGYNDTGDLVKDGRKIEVKVNTRGTDLGCTDREIALYRGRPVVLVVPRCCFELRLEAILPGWIWPHEIEAAAHMKTSAGLHYVHYSELRPITELDSALGLET